MERRIGILLAAGFGRRMRRFKQLLPWRGDQEEKPLVAASFDAVAGVCDQMVAVLGYRADDVAQALAPRSFIRVDSDPSQPMFESIRTGLRQVLRVDDRANVLIHPADHPQVSLETLCALLRVVDENPRQIVMPEHEGHGGHPVFIPAETVQDLITWSGDGGLRQFWRDNSQLCIRLAVDDAGVVRDLDTPQDYL